MTRTSRLLVAVTILLGAGGCGSNIAPAPTPLGVSNELAVFLDRETGFATNDVYDAQDQPMRFNANGDLDGLGHWNSVHTSEFRRSQ